MTGPTAYLAADGYAEALAAELGAVERAHGRLLIAAGAAAAGGVGRQCLAGRPRDRDRLDLRRGA